MNGSPISGDGCNLFVASLPPGTNDARLLELFTPYGRIISAKVMVDLNTKRLRNHGFVRYSAPHEAAAAINALHRRRIDEVSAPIHVALSTHNDNDRSVECDVVYVRNLPDSVSVEQLRQVFARFGTIVDVTLPSNAHAGHQGVGFVRYASVDDARSAVQQAHNSTPFGDGRALQVRFKETRQMSMRRSTSTVKPKSDQVSPSASGVNSPAFLSAAGSPNDHSLNAAVSPHNFSLNGTPQAAAVPTAVGNQMSPTTGLILLPVNASPPMHTINPAPGPMAMGGAAGAPMMLPTGVALGSGPASPPTFSLAAATNSSPTFAAGLHPTPPPPMGMYAPQQQHQPQPAFKPITTTRPFPGENDLFFANYHSEEWLAEVLRPWNPVLLHRHNNTMLVRLADENLHYTAAQTLNNAAGPNGVLLTVALVRV